MVRTLSVRVPFDYVLKSERDLAVVEQTRFVLRPLSGLDKLTMASAASAGETPNESLGIAAAWAAKNCLVGWHNLLDEDGKPVQFSRSAIATLPLEVVSEIGYLLIGDSEVSEEDAGKSESRSDSHSESSETSVPPAS